MTVPSAVTGRCRIPCFFMMAIASVRGSSSSMATNDLLMQDDTVVVFGSSPFATTFRLRSVSVTMPTSCFPFLDASVAPSTVIVPPLPLPVAVAEKGIVLRITVPSVPAPLASSQIVPAF